MKRMWIVGVLVLGMAGMAATPAGAVGNNANAKLCQKDGWKTLFRSDGSTFANQGACVSYAAHGNAILTEPPEPPNAWKAACEQGGGTFSVTNEGFAGNPLPLPQYAYRCETVSAETVNVLIQICGGYPDDLHADFFIDRTLGIALVVCVRAGTA